jgi:hypothetical protein
LGGSGLRLLHLGGFVLLKGRGEQAMSLFILLSVYIACRILRGFTNSHIAFTTFWCILDILADSASVNFLKPVRLLPTAPLDLFDHFIFSQLQATRQPNPKPQAWRLSSKKASETTANCEDQNAPKSATDTASNRDSQPTYTVVPKRNIAYPNMTTSPRTSKKAADLSGSAVSHRSPFKGLNVPPDFLDINYIVEPVDI